jgi:large subunit ribosomal protein L17
MRKLNKGRKLSRKIGPRKNLLRVMANNILMQERMQTTDPKAKELRSVVERFITRAKDATVANRRILAEVLTPEMTKKIVEKIAPMYKDRNGGYTRITKLGPRKSDGASMVIIELVK